MIDPTSIAKIIKQLHDTDNYWIAYSGGMDSHVLLHLVAQSLPRQHLTAVHINHGLSPHSHVWQQHCAEVCQQLNIQFQVLSVNAHPVPGQSPEAAARDARYDALLTLIDQNAALLTAHQQDDQAETLLLQMLRGGGTAGLAAMPAKKPFGNGYLIRPLLQFTRAELLSYAQQHDLTWIEDESNKDSRFDRNYLRLELFPILNKRWPHVKSILSKLAQQFADDEVILNTLAQIDLNQCQGHAQNSLSIDRLLELAEIRQRNSLRYWLRNLLGIFPSRTIVEAIQANIFHAKEDAQPLVEWQDRLIRRYENHLYIDQIPLPLDDEQIIGWQDLQQHLLLPAKLGHLVATWQDNPTQSVLLLPKNAELKIQFRQGGERLHVVGRQGSHPLKKLFQEWHIPPWLRDRMPLIYFEDTLIAVPGYGIAQEFAAQIGSAGYLIHWERN